MDKKKFAKILLSRFAALDEWGRYHLISCLILAESELRGKEAERIEDLEEFEEWSITIMEGLFPEEIGDVIPLEEWEQDEQG